jgi:hypothetical protein
VFNFENLPWFIGKPSIPLHPKCLEGSPGEFHEADTQAALEMPVREEQTRRRRTRRFRSEPHHRRLACLMLVCRGGVSGEKK